MAEGRVEGDGGREVPAKGMNENGVGVGVMKGGQGGG